jgi:short-subunit dehydrogenase
MGQTGVVSFEVAGRTVLVTGASSGIGAGLAEAFAARGATVGLCARRTDRLDETLARCHEAGGDGHRSWTVDLALPEQVDALAASVLAAWGGVDVLVNNAGIPKRRHVTELDIATVESVMALNFTSAVRLTLALLPAMLERRAGMIVNLSSVGATLSSPGEAAYDASKSALAVFTESMAVDLWDTGVTTLVVYPGVVDTELFDQPDNDPFTAPVEPIPVSELVEGVFAALDAGRRQVYVPEFFGELAAGKAADVDGFLAGAAEFVRTGRTDLA